MKKLIDATQPLTTANSFVNQADSTGLPSRITQAIQTAAAKTGVDFSYLMNKAAQESGFDQNAKSSSSSATGLFQFTSQTWLKMVKDHGAQYGLGNYASQIQADSNGSLHVGNASTKQAILNLRKDPQISAEMAGELDKENLTSLQSNVGGKIGATDLYMAHFLGAGGASDFLNSMRANPNAKAADILPEAAASNPSVFYNADGKAKSLSQIYNHFAQKFDSKSSATLVASANNSRYTPATSSTVLSATAITSKALSSPVSYISIADASQSNLAAPISANTVQSQASSLMATMILAQSDMGQMSATAFGTNPSSAQTEQTRKNAIEVLGSIA